MNFESRHLFLFALFINLVSANLFVTANTLDVIEYVGKEVTMYTTVRGDPSLTAENIKWIKMLGEMPEDRTQITYDLDTNESKLKIYNLEYSDEGTYYCTASKDGVSKSVSITLRVFADLEVTAKILDYFGYVGEEVTMLATVRGDPPLTADDIEWTKIPGEMPEDRIQITYNLDTNESKLKINDLGFSDEGTYYCYAYNRDGVRKGVSMTLRIIETEKENEENKEEGEKECEETHICLSSTSALTAGTELILVAFLAGNALA